MHLGDDVHVFAEGLDAAVVALAPLTDLDHVEEDLPQHQTCEKVSHLNVWTLDSPKVLCLE